jgi:3-methylcrotonyl-CoA carboxylase alpha subunit
MLAKLIAYADTRDEALDKLSRALDETSIFGIVTNQDFLKRLIALPATRKATFHTRLIDEQLSELVDKPASVDAGVLAFGAYYWMMRQRQPASPDPWRSRQITGWRMDAGDAGLSPIPILHLESAGASAEIRFGPLKPDGSMLIGVNDEQVPVKLVALQDENFTAIAGSRIETVRIHQDDQTIFLHDRRRAHTLTAIPYLTYISATAEVSGELRAPMTGVISKVNVAVGDPIKAGDVAVTMESMKMELRIASEMDGFVTAVHVRSGETIERNAVVVVVEPERPS